MPGAKAEEASTSDEQANGHASSDSPRETVTVTVTDVTSGSRFYVQVTCLPSVCDVMVDAASNHAFTCTLTGACCPK